MYFDETVLVRVVPPNVRTLGSVRILKRPCAYFTGLFLNPRMDTYFPWVLSLFEDSPFKGLRYNLRKNKLLARS